MRKKIIEIYWDDEKLETRIKTHPRFKKLQIVHQMDVRQDITKDLEKVRDRFQKWCNSKSGWGRAKM